MPEWEASPASALSAPTVATGHAVLAAALLVVAEVAAGSEHIRDEG
jgi:hypothetical protein